MKPLAKGKNDAITYFIYLCTRFHEKFQSKDHIVKVFLPKLREINYAFWLWFHRKIGTNYKVSNLTDFSKFTCNTQLLPLLFIIKILTTKFGCTDLVPLKHLIMSIITQKWRHFDIQLDLVYCVVLVTRKLTQFSRLTQFLKVELLNNKIFVKRFCVFTFQK